MKAFRISNEVKEKLYSISDETINELLERAFCEGYEYAQHEYSWKGFALGTSLGVASLFGGHGQAMAQSNVANSNMPTRDTVGVTVNGKSYDRQTYQGDWGDLLKYANKQAAQKKLTDRELKSNFRTAFRDRNKTPDHWKANQSSYVGKSSFNIAGKVAASHGQNPWSAIKTNNDNRGNVSFVIN